MFIINLIARMCIVLIIYLIIRDERKENMKKKNFLLFIPLATSLLLMGCDSKTSSGESNSLVVNTSGVSEDNHEPTTYYTSPDAKSEGLGTYDDPIEIYRAFSNLKAGDTLILKDGNYETPKRFYILEGTQNGTEDKPITVKAENDGKALLDFKRMGFGSNNRGLQLCSDWWHVKGLVVKSAGDNGIYIGGNHITVENCEVYYCNDTGIQIGRANSLQQDIASWPSYNTVLNCTSHDNSDPTGEDADGFACKLTTGIGNVFKGCIAYNNIDDGWDLYTKGDTGAIGPVTIEDCVAFNNGVASDGHGKESSDGNGFKLGGEQIAVQHIVKNCVAFNNLAHGFTDNSNPGTIRLENCTSFNNSIREPDGNNIDLNRENVTSNGNYFKNILSYSSGDYSKTTDSYEKEMTNSYDHYYGSADHCVFFYGLTTFFIEGPEKCDYTDETYRGISFVPENAPFVSTEVPQTGKNSDGTFDYYLLRDSNYNVDLGDFLRVNPNSEFATMGTNGSALGANLHGNRG